MEKETLEEAAENYGWRIKTNSFSDRVKANELAESTKQDFIAGAEWQAEKNELRLKHKKALLDNCEKCLVMKIKQAERMYSEEEVIKLVDGAFHMYASSHRHDAKAWLIEQFKKK